MKGARGMNSNDRFVLLQEHVDFLRTKYSDIDVAQRILSVEKNLHFEVSVDDSKAFYNWLDTESVMTMDRNDEPTHDTYIIEEIMDYLFYQSQK